jgi:hypothetical protein
MGEMADYYRDLSMIEDLEKEFSMKGEDAEYIRLGDKKWLTKDKKVMLISEMPTLHLENTIKAIENRKINLNFPVDWII